MGVSLALVGCGAMGSALLQGWLTLPDLESRFKDFWVIAPNREKVDPFLKDHRVHWISSPDQLPHKPDIIVFAVKPFILKDILSLYKSFNSLFITVATGKSLGFYESHLPLTLSLVRAMPNTPVSIHQGVIGLLANTHVTANHKMMAETCFQGLGFCTWVKSDDELDKMTAISGSGPAYVFLMIESLAHAAVSLGFDKETALHLSLHTFLGASKYACDSIESPQALRRHVTSPKGTTAEALKVLETGKLYNLIEAAVKAGYNRARELGDERKSL